MEEAMVPIGLVSCSPPGQVGKNEGYILDMEIHFSVECYMVMPEHIVTQLELFEGRQSSGLPWPLPQTTKGKSQ